LRKMRWLPPVERPLARRIYPNLSDLDTPCRDPVPIIIWKVVMFSDRADSVSFERTRRARRKNVRLAF
jgi:hypothetical protein